MLANTTSAAAPIPAAMASAPVPRATDLWMPKARIANNGPRKETNEAFLAEQMLSLFHVDGLSDVSLDRSWEKHDRHISVALLSRSALWCLLGYGLRVIGEADSVVVPHSLAFVGIFLYS